MTDTTTASHEAVPEERQRWRLSLDLFAIPLGIAALATSWTILTPAWGPAALIADGIAWVAALAWAGMTVLYVAHLVRGRHGLADLRHPTYGPLAAYIPVIGILISTHFRASLDAEFLSILIVVLAVLLVLVQAWLLRTWIVGEMAFDGIHPGYLLPLVAGAFVAGYGLGEVGLTGVAWASMGLGLFFWCVIGTAVLFRLFLGAPLREPARPTIAILMSPPAVAGFAWLTLTGDSVGTVVYMFLGVLAVVVLAQVMLLSFYLRTPFSLGFWAFTFPLCATVTLTTHVIELEKPIGWEVTAISLVGSVTVIVLWIATRSLLLYSRPSTEASPHLLDDGGAGRLRGRLDAETEHPKEVQMSHVDDERPTSARTRTTAQKGCTTG